MNHASPSSPFLLTSINPRHKYKYNYNKPTTISTASPLWLSLSVVVLLVAITAAKRIDTSTPTLSTAFLHHIPPPTSHKSFAPSFRRTTLTPGDTRSTSRRHHHPIASSVLPLQHNDDDNRTIMSSSSSLLPLMHDNAFLSNKSAHKCNDDYDENAAATTKVVLIILNTPGLNADLIHNIVVPLPPASSSITGVTAARSHHQQQHYEQEEEPTKKQTTTTTPVSSSTSKNTTTRMRMASAATAEYNTYAYTCTTSIFQRLWDLSSYRVCADGGANRLLDAVTEATATATATANIDDPDDEQQVVDDDRLRYFIPDLICGDLDSLRDDVRQYYGRNGCAIEQDLDQDTNDLDKCLQAVAAKQKQYCEEESMSSPSSSPHLPYVVCVFGAFGGRLDQEMASINALYRWRGKFGRLILYTEETSALLLPEGVENQIIINEELEGPTCGLIPIGMRCESCTTTGLKWNLNDSVLEFGGMVSSSNHVVDDEVVTVKASSPLIWTTEMKQQNEN